MRALILSLLVVTTCAADSTENSFSRVAQILAKHCLDCHAVDDPEGKFIVENHDLIMKGGESGPAIIPGKSDDSLLIKMVEGKFEKDGKVKFMPPGKREKLTSEEIAAIKSWINAGAPAPSEPTVVAREIVVPKIAPKVQPRRSIHALSFTTNGNLLAEFSAGIGGPEFYFFGRSCRSRAFYRRATEQVHRWRRSGR